MNKFKLVALILISLVSFTTNAQWVSLDKTTIQNPTAPKTTLLSSDENSTVIKIDITGFDKNNKTIDGTDYQFIDLNTDVFSLEVGSPSVPQISKVIAVPNNAPVSVEIVETGKTYTFDNINLPPARKSWQEGDSEATYEKNVARYSSNEVYPSKIASIGKPSIFRDFRVVRLAISPVRYNPSTKQLEVTSSITVRLNYSGHGEIINPKTLPDRAIAPSFDKLYKSTIFNYAEVLKNTRDTEVSGNELMLCIMPDVLYDDFLPYADWKRRSGIDIRVTKFSDIGATASNPITIKNYIASAYTTWDKPPTYVLLVGDSDKLPYKQVSYDYTIVSEDYFVEVEGDDYLPEMMIGRFTNKGNYRMKVMTNKFMKYEREPYVEDTDWFKKGICTSNNNYESQVATKVFTRNVMLNDGGFTHVDAYMSDYPCPANNTDVISAINEGRSFLNYRGEGWSSGWWASCTDLKVNDLGAINNGQKFTFFTSIGCGVAMFNADEGNCFGEELVQMGTISNPKGAIAFVGPTSNTHTQFNNKIDKGIYVGMFRENMETPGEGLLRGKLYMYNVFGENYDDGGGYNYVEYHYRVYTVLGDPSIHIWKEIPLAINAEHTTFVEEGVNNIGVTITYEDSGLPAVNAQVTLTDNADLFITGFTDDNGLVNLNGNIPNPGAINVTARGVDIIPYLGTINVNALGVENITTDIAGLTSKPNPIINGGGTEISYSLYEKNNTSIKIYNSIGQLVRNLQNELQTPGNYSVQWDGTNDKGQTLSAGVYYCQLVSGKSVGSIKLLILE